MEVYRRITERVRGALWAHHRRLMAERQFHRILAYVYNNKYEYQIRFDKMEVVGSEWDGRVEVVTTPAGFLKRVRVNPEVEDLSPQRQQQLVMSAYSKACKEGRTLMEQAELQVYKQFLKDLKPIIMGIRDNPEFYTVPEDSVETYGGTLLKAKEKPDLVHRTVPAAKALQPAHEVRRRWEWEDRWLGSPQGRNWARTLRGKEYLAKFGPQHRPRGAPGAKKRVLPFELQAAYTPMDEGRLLRRNWMAYMDNKHVAETLWTRAKVADREKKLVELQQSGQAWHRPINEDVVNRCERTDGTRRWPRGSHPSATEDRIMAATEPFSHSPSGSTIAERSIDRAFLSEAFSPRESSALLSLSRTEAPPLARPSTQDMGEIPLPARFSRTDSKPALQLRTPTRADSLTSATAVSESVELLGLGQKPKGALVDSNFLSIITIGDDSEGDIANPSSPPPLAPVPSPFLTPVFSHYNSAQVLFPPALSVDEVEEVTSFIDHEPSFPAPSVTTTTTTGAAEARAVSVRDETDHQEHHSPLSSMWSRRRSVPSPLTSPSLNRVLMSPSRDEPEERQEGQRGHADIDKTAVQRAARYLKFEDGISADGAVAASVAAQEGHVDVDRAPSSVEKLETSVAAIAPGAPPPALPLPRRRLTLCHVSAPLIENTAAPASDPQLQWRSSSRYRDGGLNHSATTSALEQALRSSALGSDGGATVSWPCAPVVEVTAVSEWSRPPPVRAVLGVRAAATHVVEAHSRAAATHQGLPFAKSPQREAALKRRSDWLGDNSASPTLLLLSNQGDSGGAGTRLWQASSQFLPGGSPERRGAGASRGPAASLNSRVSSASSALVRWRNHSTVERRTGLSNGNDTPTNGTYQPSAIHARRRDVAFVPYDGGNTTSRAATPRTRGGCAASASPILACTHMPSRQSSLPHERLLSPPHHTAHTSTTMTTTGGGEEEGEGKGGLRSPRVDAIHGLNSSPSRDDSSGLTRHCDAMSTMLSSSSSGGAEVCPLASELARLSVEVRHLLHKHGL